MSSQSPHTDRSVMGTRGSTEPLASMIEHQARLASSCAMMMEQLGRLDGDWIVSGPGRIERWQGVTSVIGPPGIFLVWPISGGAEPALGLSSQMCRRYIHAKQGPQFRGAVEIVFFQPRHVEGVGRLERVIYPGGPDGLPSTDFFLAEGQHLDLLLRGWEPPEGLDRLSPEWIRELRAASAPRWRVRGPDDPARQLPLVDEPDDWSDER